jgi:hypothetical protein
MQQHGVTSGGRARPWRIFSPKRLPSCRKLWESGYSWSRAWEEHFPSASWLDHSEVWMKDGRAVCVTGQPYVLDERADRRAAHAEPLGHIAHGQELLREHRPNAALEPVPGSVSARP